MPHALCEVSTHNSGAYPRTPTRADQARAPASADLDLVPEGPGSRLQLGALEEPFGSEGGVSRCPGSANARIRPDTSPAEEIGHFTSQGTPSSRAIDRRSSGAGAVVPSTSSPTPAARRKLLEDLDEDEKDETLDEALRRETAVEAERKLWAQRKAAALKAKEARDARTNDDDDFIIEREVKPRAGPSRPSVAASRQIPRFGQASNRAAPKRPASGRKGPDIPITHARLTADLMGRHYEQAHKLEREREDKYGGSRRLPEKQELELGTIIPASASAEAEDSEDDDSDFAPDGEDAEVEVWSGEEDEAAPMPSSEAGSEDEAEEDEDKENQPVVGPSVSEDEDEGFVPLKRKTKARVTFHSDDEGEEPAGKPLQEAKRQPLAPTPDSGPSPGGFGADFGAAFGDDGEGGFSQLFAETQGGFGEVS